MTTLTAAALAAALVAAPAQAGKPADRDGGSTKNAKSHGKAKGKSKSSKGKSKGTKGKSRSCTPRSKAYVAKGTLEALTLTRNADGTYDGTLTVKVTKTNRHGRSHDDSSQTYTLDDAKVRGAETAKVGDRAHLRGKITTLKRGCDASGFTPETTIRKATLKSAEPTTTESTETSSGESNAS